MIQTLEKPNILLVDDRPENLEVLLNLLEEFDANLITAGDGNEALELALKHDFALVLMDVQMPKMNGFETAELMRTRNKTPIIFVTALNREEAHVFEGYETGAVDYLCKPINPHILKSKVAVFVELDQQKKQLEHLNLTLEERVRERTEELRELNESLERFVPYQFLSLLQKKNIIEVQPGDHVEKIMSILFADIRSFTTLSENMSPDENFQFINSYLSIMVPPIQNHGGFIDKYIGDGIMALFENADDALKASIAMSQTLWTYNQFRRNTGYSPIKIGIGINTGNLMLGTIGGKIRMDGTVIGDAVNLASRIEQLNKTYQTAVLLGADTFLSLEDSLQYTIRFIDCVKVNGKAKEVMIFEALDAEIPEMKEKKCSTFRIFEEAIALYQSQEYQKAHRLFQDCLSKNPADQAAQIYLERCEHIFSEKPLTQQRGLKKSVA